MAETVEKEQPAPRIGDTLASTQGTPSQNNDGWSQPDGWGQSEKVEKEQPTPSIWDTLASTQGAPSQNKEGWGQPDGWGQSETVEKEQPKPSIWDTLASTQGAPSQNNDGWGQPDGWGQSEKVEKEQPTPSIWDTLASTQGAPSQNNEGWGQPDGWGQSETVEKEQPKPIIWDTLASTQGAPSQNNDGWDQSDGWGQSVKNDRQWKSDGWGTSSNQRESDDHSWTRSSTRSPGRGRTRDVRRNPRSTGGDSRQLSDRRKYWKEESPSPPCLGRNASRHFQRYRDEPSCDLRRRSWSKQEASQSPRCSTPYTRREASRHNWGTRGESSAWSQKDHPVSPHSRTEENNWIERSPGKRRRSHSPNADLSKSQGTCPVSTSITQVERENKPGLPGCSSTRLILPDLNGRNGDDGWGTVSPAMIQSRSRSSSPWSQAAQNVKKSDNAKKADGWGLSSLPVDQSRSRSLSPWSQAAHDLKQNCHTKETDGWGKAFDKTGPDASNNSRPNISPDRAFNRRRGGWGSTRLTFPDLNRRNGDDGWGTVSPAMIRSRSRSSSPWSQAAQNVKKSDDAKESDGWGPSSLNVDQSRSRSLSPWAQAAHDIKKNYHNKETDRWGKALDKTGPDIWNKYRPNTSPDCAFNRRRGGWGSRDRSRSPVPRWRRTERDQDRSRGRDSSYVPCNGQRKSIWDQGGSGSRESGCTNSPGRGQNRVERVMNEAFSREPQISSQTHGDVKGKTVMNSPIIEHSTACDPWDINALSSRSDAMGAISVNRVASQVSNQRNPNLDYSADASRSQLLGLESNITGSILASNPFISNPWSVPRNMPDPWSMPNNWSVPPNMPNPWSMPPNMLQSNPTSRWDPSTTPFNYPTLEQDIRFAPTSSLLNWGGPKSNFVPIGWRPPHIPMLNAPTMSNGVHSANLPPFASSNSTHTAMSYGEPKSNLMPIGWRPPHMLMLDAPTMSYAVDNAATTSERVVNVLPNFPPFASGNDTRTAMAQVAPLYSPIACAVSSTSCAFPEARPPKPNMDAAVQCKSCTATKAETSQGRGTDEAESSAINPTPMVSMSRLSQPNENPIMANGAVPGATRDKVDNITFKRVLIEFAKAKLRPFWIKQRLTKEEYLFILKNFVDNVAGSSSFPAPQTDADSHNFIKEEDDSLSKYLKKYLLRYVSEEIIENLRDS